MGGHRFYMVRAEVSEELSPSQRKQLLEALRKCALALRIANTRVVRVSAKFEPEPKPKPRKKPPVRRAK